MPVGRVQEGVLVTHFEDGSPYEYQPQEGPATNVGWLDAAHEYSKGPVSPEFVRLLSELCRAGVLHMRGWHMCNLCVPDEERRSYSDLVPTLVKAEGGDYSVGHAEIRVPGLGGVMYAAPDMVIHYVVVHGYRPPDGFIEAVLRPS